MYTEIVSYKLALLLNNTITDYECVYAAQNLEVTYENYLTVNTFKEGELIVDFPECYIHGKCYGAPTYADVLDYLKSKQIIIQLTPSFTYSLNDRVAYFIKALKINEENSSLETLFEDNLTTYRFEQAIEIIVEKLKKINLI